MGTEQNEIRDLILRMKEAKQHKHLSFQSIADACERNGAAVSKSSVARVFADGSENNTFWYETTLKPIAQVVLGVEDPLAPPDPPELSGGELLQEIQQQREQEITELRGRYERRLSEKDEEIARLRQSGKWRTVAIIVLGTLLIMFMAIAIGYLAWDLTHPTQGAFQWE